MKPLVLTPIGVVRSTRKNPEDDNWDSEKTFIEIDKAQFSSESFAGLEEFSHVEILFHMDQVEQSKIEKSARHPRNNSEWPKVGIFAQRGKNRPNQVGVSVCKIIKIEGFRILVQGLDAIDGSPIIDIKPWVKEFGPRGEVFQPKWISELMKGYWES